MKQLLIQAFIVGLILAALLMATGCASSDRVLVTDCHEVMNRPTFDCSKKVK